MQETHQQFTAAAFTTSMLKLQRSYIDYIDELKIRCTSPIEIRWVIFPTKLRCRHFGILRVEIRIWSLGVVNTRLWRTECDHLPWQLWTLLETLQGRRGKKKVNRAALAEEAEAQHKQSRGVGGYNLPPKSMEAEIGSSTKGSCSTSILLEDPDNVSWCFNTLVSSILIRPCWVFTNTRWPHRSESKEDASLLLHLVTFLTALHHPAPHLQVKHVEAAANTMRVRWILPKYHSYMCHMSHEWNIWNWA